MLIQKQRPNYQPVPGVLAPIPIREFRGVNTFDPLSIADNFFMDMENMISDDYPAISVRPGYSVLGTFSGPIRGMGVWKNQELHVIANGEWWKYTGSWTKLATGLDPNAEWSFTNFQGSFSDINLIASNGVDPIKKYNGSSVSNLSGAPSGGNFVTTYQNRVWCAVGKELHACALDNAEQWTKFDGFEDDSYVKDMESTAGEDINMLSGGLTKLTIGMKNSLHELYGGLPSDFNTRLVTEDTGVINYKSAVIQDGIMRFIHRTGVYEYAGGVIPDKSFSEIVKGYIDPVSDSVAGTDGIKLYFKMQLNRILVYDPRFQTWNVWRGIDATHFINLGGFLYIGDENGRVLLLGQETDGGTPISWYVTTKPFTNQSISQKLRWYKIWLTMDFAAGTTITVSLSRTVDEEDWEEVFTYTAPGNIESKRIIIPVSKMANENYIRLKIEGTGWARIHEITRQQRELPLF